MLKYSSVLRLFDGAEKRHISELNRSLVDQVKPIADEPAATLIDPC
jgi:hypothetical protein